MTTLYNAGVAHIGRANEKMSRVIRRRLAVQHNRQTRDIDQGDEGSREASKFWIAGSMIDAAKPGALTIGG